MQRLDRREYKCRHCGAVTVISDNDADRIERLLQQFLARQSPPPPRRLQRPRLLAAAILCIAGLIAGLTILLHGNRSGSQAFTADTYFAEQSVSPDKIVMSALTWQPDSSGGSYTGLLYNHSGYAINPPTYQLNLFRGGMKSGSAASLAVVSILEPGEYMPVQFRIDNGKPAERYEVQQPEHILHSLFDPAPLSLQRPTLVHVQDAPSYALVGIVRNTLNRPVEGGGELMLYASDGRVVGSGVGSFPKLMPGEQAIVTLNAFPYSREVEVAACEYLLDAFFDPSEQQTLTYEQTRQAGKKTVPSRILRLDHPRVHVFPAGTEPTPQQMLQQ